VKELTLVFVFQASGILLSPALARLPAPPIAVGSVRRIAQAIERAGSAFLLRAGGRLAIATGVLLLAVVGIGAARGDLHASAAGALALALGTALAATAAFAGAILQSRASGPALAAAERRLDLTLSTLLGAGGAAGVLAQTLGALGTLGLFLADFRLRQAAGVAQADAARVRPGTPGVRTRSRADRPRRGGLGRKLPHRS
jgi:hypothetical protein